MAWSENAYYKETTINGWRWRVELHPHDIYESVNNLVSATYEPNWVEFDTDIMFDISSNCESKYSDTLPIGYPTARSVKFTLNIAEMSAEAVESIRQLNRELVTYPTLSPNSKFECLNLWILRTDYGNSATNYTISGVGGSIPSAPAYFVGLQKLAPTAETEIYQETNAVGEVSYVSLYELECVDAIFEFNRQCKIEWLGDALLEHDTDANSMRNYTGSVYEFVKPGKVKVKVGSAYSNEDGFISYCEDNAPLSAVTMSFADIRTIYHKYLRTYLLTLRLQQNRFTISSEGFLHYEFVRFFRNPGNGFTTGSDLTNDSDLYFIAGTATGSGGSYSRTFGGIFEKNDKSGALFEGETINDLCQNLALTFAHKAVYRIRGGNTLVNSTTGLLQAFTHDDGIAYDRDTITINDDAIGKITIGTGDNAGVVKSFIYNVDNSPEDKNVTTYKAGNFGNQSENDFEKKAIVHNLPRLDNIKQETDPNLTYTVKQRNRVENSIFLRRIFSFDTANGTINANHPVRVHEFCKYALKRAYSFPNNPVWVNDEFSYTPLHSNLNDWNGSTNEEKIANYCNHIQLNLGQSKLIAETLSSVFVPKNMFLLTITVEMNSKRNSNCIGEMYNLVFPSATMFDDYTNVRACLVDVSDDILKGLCTMKLLGVIEE